MKKDRTLEKSIELLVWVWLKWVENNEKTRIETISLEERVNAAKKCEKLQIWRRILIFEIDNFFDLKFYK